MNRQVWTVSNLLSVLRVILVLPIATLAASHTPGDRLLAAGLIALAAATDYFDGVVARKLNQVTDLGKIIDPFADKIAVGVVCVILALHGKLPVWFVVSAILRDLLILTGGVIVKKSRGILLQSNIVGKWAVGVAAMYIFVLVLDVGGAGWLETILLYASALMLLASFLLYLQRFTSIMKPNSSVTRP
ncbi:MAG TPA: CDP-alcohol phosphatidyltransferase family protein [Bacteroidota bacterium]|jgi:CDP-diacylglycerol--glycerol-3-phosphate 3-phosphatidyltransferase|nr:CDP-alcohol phosphatidyltransferase family protein [Bacteroidota bacterium]